MRCDHPPVQEDTVRLYKKSFRLEVNGKLVGVNAKTFNHLNDIVAEIELFFVDIGPRQKQLVQGAGWSSQRGPSKGLRARSSKDWGQK